MEYLKALRSLGLSLPSPAFFFGAVLFTLSGYTAYRWGKFTGRQMPIWIGTALMLFPYVMAETWQLYAMGAGLFAALFAFRPGADTGEVAATSEERDEGGGGQADGGAA